MTQIPAQPPYDLILVDDDELIHMTWQLSARGEGYNILCLYAEPNIIEKLKSFPLNQAIFVDACLGQNLSGETLLQDLWNLGYKNIYLTTGYQPEDFAHLTCVKAVISKDPPWDMLSGSK